MSRILLAAAKSRLSPALSNMGHGWGIGRMRIEVLAGLTVALSLVPEAVAFAFVAGVHPLVGLYAAFIVGLITALIGGRRFLLARQADNSSSSAAALGVLPDREFSGTGIEA